MSGLRRARPTDLGALTELWLALSRHHASCDPLYTLREGAQGEVRIMLAEELQNRSSLVLVHEEAGAAVAYCIVEIVRARPIYEEARRAELHDLYVAPGTRRRGVGRALVDAALAWVREQGVERVELRVVHGNAEGQAFWRALGFTDLMDGLQRRL